MPLKRNVGKSVVRQARDTYQEILLLGKALRYRGAPAAQPPGSHAGWNTLRINPDALQGGDTDKSGVDITIRHGESVTTLPAGSSVEAVAELVKALKRHA